MNKRDEILHRCELATFEGVPPTYILDLNYCFLSWNHVFDELVAKPLGLKLGKHALELLRKLDNWDAVMERSTRVFSVAGSLPYVDQEPLIWSSKKFGRISFRKLATQIIDDDGEHFAWVVHLAIDDCEKREELWQAIEKLLEERLIALGKKKTP